MPIIANQQQADFLRKLGHYLFGEEIVPPITATGYEPVQDDPLEDVYNLMVPRTRGEVGLEFATGALPSTAAIRAFQRLLRKTPVGPGELDEVNKVLRHVSQKRPKKELSATDVRVMGRDMQRDLKKVKKPDDGADYLPPVRKEPEGEIVPFAKTTPFDEPHKVRKDFAGAEDWPVEDYELMDMDELRDARRWHEARFQTHYDKVQDLERAAAKEHTGATHMIPVDKPQPSAAPFPPGPSIAPPRRRYGMEVKRQHERATPKLKHHEAELTKPSDVPVKQFGSRRGDEVASSSDLITISRNKRLEAQLPSPPVTVQQSKDLAIKHMEEAQKIDEIIAAGGYEKYAAQQRKRRPLGERDIQFRRQIGGREEGRDLIHTIREPSQGWEVTNKQRKVLSEDVPYDVAERDFPQAGIKKGDPLVPQEEYIGTIAGTGKPIPKAGVKSPEPYSGGKGIHELKDLSPEELESWNKSLERVKNPNADEIARITSEIAQQQKMAAAVPTHLRGAYNWRIDRLKYRMQSLSEAPEEIVIKRMGNE